MKTDTKPFDLEKALAGEPVVLRNGNKAYIRHHETELDTADPLIGYAVEGGMVDTLEWTEDGHYFWDKEETGYDIVGMWTDPLVFNHWDLMTEHIKYLAKDSDGDWFGYSGKPTKEKEWWVSQPYVGYYSVEAINPSLFPDCVWENSLMERPESE